MPLVLILFNLVYSFHKIVFIYTRILQLCKNKIKVFSKIRLYFSLVKFSHTVFAMPFALIGFFIAINESKADFSWQLLIYIVLCMIFARNAAMAFNRYCDRFIDKNNPRTANREIPAGKIGKNQALAFTIVNSVLFVIGSYLINLTVFFLSPIALLIILTYSYTKRFTFLSHLILGLGLSVAPIGAYIAVQENISPTILILAAVVLLWSAGFDIIYSLQDEDFDRENNLFSIPAKYGRIKALYISAFIHIVCSILLVYFNIAMEANIFLWIGTSIFLILLIYQHTIVKPADISRVNLAFGTLNGIASVIFAILAILSIYYTA